MIDKGKDGQGKDVSNAFGEDWVLCRVDHLFQSQALRERSPCRNPHLDFEPRRKPCNRSTLYRREGTSPHAG